jgi:hypothetical protein
LFTPLSEAKRLDLTINAQIAKAHLGLTLTGTGARYLVYQSGYVNGSGKTIYTQVASHALVAPAPPPPAASALPGIPPGPRLPPLPGLPPIVLGPSVPGPRAKVRVAIADAPKSKSVNHSLTGADRSFQDLGVTELTLDVRNVPGCICWAKDGKSFYYLDGSTGTLGHVVLEGFREDRQLGIGRKCTWLSTSAMGLLVTVADLQEVWLVDPSTLQVKDRFTAASVQRAVSAPSLSIALVGGASTPFNGNGLSIIDLQKGELITQSFNSADGRRALIGFDRPTVTPDGKYVFTIGGLEALHRFRIDGTRLVHEESSQRIAQGHIEAGICVSPDSRLVCLPSGGGNYAVGTPLPAYSTYVYKVDNLHAPACTLAQGAYPEAVGFDPRGGYIYSQNMSSFLLAFSNEGVKLKDYTLSGGQPGFRRRRQMLAHPQGGSLLLLTSEKLYYVVMPKRG